MNCSTRYGRFSTAAALRLERGTLLTAMPSIVQVATPSRKTQVKVSQRTPLPGSLSPYSAMPMPSRMATSIAAMTRQDSALPAK